MSVELNPSSQLGFHRPLTQLVKRTLTISNQNAQPVAFKVKTTAPKQYCVRPNSGRIEPGERVEVQVLLQPMKEEPAPGTKCRDKFLVQSAYITPDREHTPVTELWTIVEAEHKAGNPDAIAEQKIRCAFLPPIDGSTEGGLGAVQESAEDGSPNMSRHGQSAFLAAESTPSKFTNGDADGLHTAPSSAFADRSAPAVGGNTVDASRERSFTAPETASATAVEKLQAAGVPTNTSELKAAASNAASTVSNAASSAAASVGLASDRAMSSTGAATSGSTGSDSLQRDLAAARAEIEKLKATIREKESEGLRQRSVGRAGDSKTSPVGSQVATIKQEGIPAQMVAALCFGVFLFTWLFF